MSTQSLSYAIKQTIISLIVSFILCFVIFIFVNPADMTLPEAAADLPITIILTCLVTALVNIPLIKSTVKKGGVPPMGNMKEQIAFAYMPKNKFLFTIVLCILAFLFFCCAPIGLLNLATPEVIFPRFVWIGVKALLAAITSGYASYNANIFMAATDQAALPAKG